MVNQLVERIRQKDQRAMSQLYQLYVEKLSSVCYRYVPSEDDAKDVLQNSFVKIFTSIPTFEYRGESAFKAWMKQVVANEALAFLKNRKKVLFVEQDQTAAKADRTKMEEEPVMAAPDIDKLQEEQQNFVIEQEKPVEHVAATESRQEQQSQTVLDDLTLDDITATPREKTREEIIAEAEAAAFSEG